jgi:hypothetical protein
VNPDPKMPKHIGRLLVGIVIGFALLALYANIQKLRRPVIESVTFTAASPQAVTPSPSPTPNR